MHHLQVFLSDFTLMNLILDLLCIPRRKEFSTTKLTILLVGVLFTGALACIVGPYIFFLLASIVPRLWTSVYTSTAPPYLFIVVNFIILTIWKLSGNRSLHTDRHPEDESSSNPTLISLRPRFKRTTRRTKKKPAAPPAVSSIYCLGFRADFGLLVQSSPSQNAIMSQNFFHVDALDLAPHLIGKILRRDEVILKITEVEAYRSNESVCHGRFGITARTAPVFGPGGHAYVYLCYGLHMMLNIVADKEGVGSEVLI